MHIVSIESLQEINTKTKEIKELKDIYLNRIMLGYSIAEM